MSFDLSPDNIRKRNEIHNAGMNAEDLNFDKKKVKRPFYNKITRNEPSKNLAYHTFERKNTKFSSWA